MYINKAPTISWWRVLATLLSVLCMLASYFYFGPIGWLVFIWLFAECCREH